MTIKDVSKKYLRLLTYLSGFFLTIHLAFPSYFNSQFLDQFLTEQQIGFIYVAASLISILLIVYAPLLIRQVGLRASIFWLALATLSATLPLAFIKTPLWALIFFVAYYSLGLGVRYVLDVYLEKISDDRTAGNIRGVFLTFMNLAWLVSPFLAGELIADRGYSIVFFISSIMLLPLIYIALFQLKESDHHRKIETPRVWTALKKLWQGKTEKSRNVRSILQADFLLNFFYAIMVIYMALYLTHDLGMSKVEIGTIFTIMLLPFVIFELPLGKIADRWLGEKEILIAGFSIIALSTGVIPFITSTSVLVWGGILFATRTGAAAVEIMKETYLFKKITDEDTDILSISRNMQPITYIIGPLIISILISWIDFKYIFLVLAVIMLYGIKVSLALKDTK